VLIGAKLLEHAGSLKRMAEMPSSTIQILGAEKALFRHLKTGSRPPKYGVLLGHSIVQQMPKAKQGKAARVLADKISLAVRIDYFKGEFRGEQLLLDVKKKLDKEHSKTSKPKKKFIEPRSESRFEKGSFEKPFRPFKPRY